MRRRWIIIGVAAAGIISAGAVVRGLHKPEAGAALPDDTYVATVQRRDLNQEVNAPGTVASNLDVEIRCRASGEVIELPYDIGDRVKKGDVLMKLDPADELVALQAARVTLDQDHSKLEVARKTVQMAELDLATGTDKAAADVEAQKVKDANIHRKADRQRDLLAQKLASQEQYEDAQTDAVQAEDDFQAALVAQRQLKSQAVDLDVKKEQAKQAEQQVELDQIALDNANLQLAYTTVTAPLDGVLSDLETQKGSMISSAISTVGGTTVMTLSDLSRIFVLASVDEADVGGVRLGQSCRITADAFPRRDFSGAVVRIAPQGQNTRNVVTFEVKIEVIDDDKELLRPEMTANVQILEETRHDAVLAPMLSLFDRDDKTYVTIVKDNNAPEDRLVQAGIDDGDNAEIISGLSAGEKILVHHNDAASKWTGLRGKSAGAASKHSAAKKKSDAHAKSDDSADDSTKSGKQKKDKDSSHDAGKHSSRKTKDDSSQDSR
ncbi:MAG: efflux RND transporter periplasmic adaptor subunit [Tepidisphaeraceae bacterium]